MAVRISHTTFDARNAYEQSVWWGELLGFPPMTCPARRMMLLI